MDLTIVTLQKLKPKRAHTDWFYLQKFKNSTNLWFSGGLMVRRQSERFGGFVLLHDPGSHFTDLFT